MKTMTVGELMDKLSEHDRADTVVLRGFNGMGAALYVGNYDLMDDTGC